MHKPPNERNRGEPDASVKLLPCPPNFRKEYLQLISPSFSPKHRPSLIYLFQQPHIYLWKIPTTTANHRSFTHPISNSNTHLKTSSARRSYTNPTDLDQPVTAMPRRPSPRFRFSNPHQPREDDRPKKSISQLPDPMESDIGFTNSI
eukprot:GHVP01049380.1.p1 GENE.GHVP01049380.1~~GHVP01049380.1.p1  ORF type:complete len:147 (-),score=6.98 GHVP01049380.1:456-896(-)